MVIIIVMMKSNYIEGVGKSTSIITRNVEYVFHGGVEKAKKVIMKKRVVCLQSISEKIRRITGKRKMNPLYLSPNEVFIPVKMSKPRVKSDTVYDYANINYIEMINEGSIVFKNGMEYEILEKRKTIIERVKKAYSLKIQLEMDVSIRKTFNCDREKIDETDRELMEIITKLIRKLINIKSK